MEDTRRFPVAGSRYRAERRLGAGGQGEAWLAWDTRLQRPVVLKQFMVPEGASAEERETLVERAGREARAAAKLNHPNVVTVHDHVTDSGGLPWIVMEYVEGRSLRDVLDDGPLPVAEAARVGERIASALAAAHAAGVVHRDIKPANILLGDGRVVLADFGIAGVAGEITLTAPGEVMGTPQYMAPEQLVDGQSSPASDLWSLGATLYRAVEGRAPFSGSTYPGLIAAVTRGVPERTRTAGALAPVIGQLLRLEPAERPAAAVVAATMREVADDLRAAGSEPADLDGLLAKGTEAREAGEFARAEDHYWSALDLAIAHRARDKEGWAWDGIGSCRWRSGDHETAMKFFTQAERVADATGNGALKAWSLYNFGVYRHRCHEPSAAREFFEQALAVAEAHQNHEAVGWTLHMLAELAGERGDSQQESEHYGTAARVGLDSGDDGLAGWSLYHAAKCAERSGDLAGAVNDFGRALEIGRRIRDRWMVQKSEEGLARLTDRA